MGTKIEWTEETWNPIVGCSPCSPGCKNCYAERMAKRQAAMALEKSTCVDVTVGQGRYVAVIGPNGKWNGSTAIDESDDNNGEMYKPCRMKKPRRIFVCSMSDLFHENNSDSAIEEVLIAQSYAPQHIYIWLTKRPERMLRFVQDRFSSNNPGKNIWCGVTVCNQEEAEEKIPLLCNIYSPIRFISIEPMLGPIDLECFGDTGCPTEFLDNIEWVIVGGESGPSARPMERVWVRKIRDQCSDAGVPFFFKQWGGVNKKLYGRILDGRTHDEYPVVENG